MNERVRLFGEWLALSLAVLGGAAVLVIELGGLPYQTIGTGVLAATGGLAFVFSWSERQAQKDRERREEQ